jgi:hypothetical protein
MDGVIIERTLWQLKLPGRIAMPAAHVLKNAV